MAPCAPALECRIYLSWKPAHADAAPAAAAAGLPARGVGKQPGSLRAMAAEVITNDVPGAAEGWSS